ncbi:hypothetical protein BB559_001682 [Furculomyces boomerangus]|uniref:DUF788-domain-containing protein n=2 Tax=Harpellales TaxID=61421 RepID=A0A2T9Z138_9FUNG|nr:hypothetical protein BB559_001682 [Furculomyces boomerangus]PVZ97522.1 hypothetical protein BB558_006516 [Smittium angustum]
MANASAKKIVAGNSAKIQRMDKTYMTINGVYIFFTFILGWSTLSYKVVIAYFITLALESFLYIQLYKISQPRFDSAGNLLSPGDDLTSPGLISYMFDIIYVTWATHLLSLFHIYAWWLYSVIPIYIGYAFGPKAFAFLRSFSGGSSSESPPTKSKRMEKMEKRQNKIKYSRN